MITQMCKKQSLLYYCLRVLLVFIIAALLFPSMGFSRKYEQIQEDVKYDDSTYIINKNEGITGGWDKNFVGGKSDLDALTKNIVKRKLDRKSQYIKELKSGKKQNDLTMKKYRKFMSAAKTNPKRFNKMVSIANGSKSPVNHSKKGKQYIEKQLMEKLKQHTAIQKALSDTKKNQSRFVASHGRYKKAQKAAGAVGKIFSLWDAAQKSYYYDEKTKTTSFSPIAYVKNATLNLTGIASITGIYQAGEQAKQKEFEKALAEYEAASDKPLTVEQVMKAWDRGVRKGQMVAAYNGAKCIPLVGDLANVYELTDASIGVVYDTMESNRIIAENTEEQGQQGQDAVSKLKAFFAQIKAKEAEFKKIQKVSEDKIEKFTNFNKQYIEVFNRLVTQEQNLASTDSLLKAADQARPFLDADRIATLQDDSKKLMLATITTVKLAKTTLENYQANGGSPEGLNNSIEELKQMASALTIRKEECDAIKNAISPLLGEGDILEVAKEQNQQMTTDSSLANDLYQQGGKLLKEHHDLVQRGEKLKTEQDTILVDSKRALSYFYRNGDPTTKSDLDIAFRNVVQYKIDEYSLRKLNEKQNTITFKFRSWRKIVPTTAEISPDFSNLRQEASLFTPEIADLCEALDTSMATTQILFKHIFELKNTASIAPTIKQKEHAPKSTKNRKRRVYFVPDNPDFDLPLTKEHHAQLTEVNTKVAFKVSERNNKFYASIPSGTYRLTIDGFDILHSEKTFLLETNTIPRKEKIIITVPFKPKQPAKTYSFTFQLSNFNEMVSYSGVREFLLTKDKRKLLFTIKQSGYLRSELSATGTGGVHVLIDDESGSEFLASAYSSSKRNIFFHRIWNNDGGDITATAIVNSSHVTRSRKSDYDDEDRVVFQGGVFSGKVTFSLLPFKKPKKTR